MEQDIWQALSNTIIAMTPVLVPLVVAFLKGKLPNIPKPMLPLVAIGLGAGIDLINAYATGLGAGMVWGAALGGFGVAIREVFHQTRKIVLASLPDDSTGAGPKVLGILFLVVMLSGCASLTQPQAVDPVAITAESAAAIGNEAVATNQTYVTYCAADKIPVADCNTWSRFFTRFQQDYALAHAAFKQALATGDPTKEAEAQQKLKALARELATLAIYGR